MVTAREGDVFLASKHAYAPLQKFGSVFIPFPIPSFLVSGIGIGISIGIVIALVLGRSLTWHGMNGTASTYIQYTETVRTPEDRILLDMWMVDGVGFATHLYIPHHDQME